MQSRKDICLSGSLEKSGKFRGFEYFRSRFA